ncbi:MAG: asparagine synthase (glutamine-hydrolyzing) [Parvibaculaceae bacterium]|nr:asparagine synthase (glutamine-hydrolyzing) [Rhodobiaceae bacterium]MDF1625698.1 asparagine synthase (glutamine-hydrolyzing) [Parvibaculaceae bacterium]
MCGIAGILASQPASLSMIGPMTRAQAHRGPDGEGFAFIGPDGHAHISTQADHAHPSQIALGHRRLAILDTSDAGLQPMASADGDHVICYNGEVYNYIELRDELSALGHIFRTGTDTEVVLAAYREWNVDAFARFNGMWALAIWDRCRQVLVLSRDRFGVKPLHVAHENGTLFFSSEIKGLLAAGIRRTLNRARAADFLRWGIVNHTHETFYDSINAFPPGHYAVVRPSEPHTVTPVAFWQPPSDAKLASRQISSHEAEAEFRRLFDSSVSLRLRSDVPVGACLSGGLDSSSIVCHASRLLPSGHRLATFTSASDNPAFDERAWSDLVNEQCQAEPHTVIPTADGFSNDFDALLQTQDEPFPSASIYAQYLLMRSAHEAHIPVLLDGQGADEALCGYRKYIVYSLMEAYQNANWLNLLAGLGWWVAQGDKGLLNLSEGVRYLPAFLRGGQADPMAGMVAPRFKEEWDASQPASKLTTYRSSERQIDDILRFSVPPLLRYEDRNSMAWSIESRVPFLDYRLVEFLLELPTSLKINRSQTKALMRRALRGDVPDKILDRRDKMGFVTPQHSWMQGPLKDRFRHAFLSDTFSIGELISGTKASDLLSAEGYWAGVSMNAAFRIFTLNRWVQLNSVTL